MADSIRLFGGRSLSFTRTNIMSIINITNDSFYEHSRTPTELSARAAVDRAVQDGADIIDIGAESTRPGSSAADPSEEADVLYRVILYARRSYPHMPISADTRHALAARSAIDAGADIINDVSGLCLDDERDAMIDIIRSSGAAYVLTHTRGTPDMMQTMPPYDDVIGEVMAFFHSRLALLERNAVNRDRVIIDPGIGFSKTFEDNLNIIAHAGVFKKLGRPLLIGASRKAFLGSIIDASSPCSTSDRLPGTLAVTSLCAAAGVEIARVHDAAENIAAARTAEAISRYRDA